MRRFAIWLAVAIAIAFPKALFGLESFVYRDFGVFGFPLAFHHKASILAGEIPLWNPFNNLGLPFLAQWNTLVLYPGSLIYLALPLPWSLNLFCLVHLFFGGLGMFRLAREFTGNGIAAALAGTAWTFSGLTLNCLIWPNNIAAFAWMPWVILCLQKAVIPGVPLRRCGAVPVAMVVGAVQMLSGAPEIVLFTWLLGILLAVSSGTPILTAILRIAVVTTGVAILAAVQLLPFLDLLKQSHRDAGFSAGEWSLPVWGPLNYLVPAFRTFPSPCGVRFQTDQYWTSSHYAGISVFVLALLAVWKVRERRVIVLAVAALLCTWMATGNEGGLYSWIRSATPWVGLMRYPVKFVVPVAFALPLLAAYGVRFWLEFPQCAVPIRQLRAWRIGLWTALAVAAIALYSYFLPQDDFDSLPTGISAATRFTLLAIALGILTALARRLRESGTIHRSLAWVLAFGIVLCLDLFTHMPWQNPTGPAAALEPWRTRSSSGVDLPALGHGRVILTSQLLEFLQSPTLENAAAELGVRRVTFANNCNLIDSIPKVDGFYSLYLPAEREINSKLMSKASLDTSGLANFLGITAVVQATNQMQSRTGAMALVSAGQQPIFTNHSATLANLLGESFDPRAIAFFPLEASAQIRASAVPQAAISRLDWAANRVAFEIESPAPVVVTVSQSYHPGWEARIDGTSAKIWQVNYGFQGLEVPAGRHSVVLAYRDRAFKMGGYVSAAGWMGVVGWLCALIIRRRRWTRGN